MDKYFITSESHLTHQNVCRVLSLDHRWLNVISSAANINIQRIKVITGLVTFEGPCLSKIES